MLQQGSKGRQGNQGQINIQDNAFNENHEVDHAREARRRNFFEKKRFINYPYPENGDVREQEKSDNTLKQMPPPNAIDGNL